MKRKKEPTSTPEPDERVIFGKRKKKEATVDLEAIQIDYRYQRYPPIQSMVSDIGTFFDDMLCLPLVLSQRKVAIFCVDGQHRLLGMRSREMARWKAILYLDLTPQEEALLWHKYNGMRNKTTPLQSFKARLFGQEREAVTIDKLVKSCGFHIVCNGGEKLKQDKYTKASGEVVRAIHAVESLYRYKLKKLHGDLLRETLEFIDKTWEKGEKDRTDGRIISAVGILFKEPRWASNMDRNRMIQRAGATTLRKLIKDAMDIKDITKSLPKAIALTMVKRYNSRLSPTKKLWHPFDLK